MQKEHTQKYYYYYYYYTYYFFIKKMKSLNIKRKFWILGANGISRICSLLHPFMRTRAQEAFSPLLKSDFTPLKLHVGNFFVIFRRILALVRSSAPLTTFYCFLVVSFPTEFPVIWIRIKLLCILVLSSMGPIVYYAWYNFHSYRCTSNHTLQISIITHELLHQRIKECHERLKYKIMLKSITDSIATQWT